MQIPLVQIDAFASAPFTGNPAAVMPLNRWLPDATLQAIALENNLAETAFLVEELPAEATPPGPGPTRHLRWFTPAVEVDLCGHATLASAAYLFDDVHPDADEIAFWTRSGWLTVRRDGAHRLRMDFPAVPLEEVAPDPAVEAALGVPVRQTFQGMDLVCLLADADAVRSVRADLSALGRMAYRGVVVTAAGDDGADFVSRFFACEAGAFEDPVTGSAHSQLAPFWAERLGRDRLTGRQLSARGGEVGCEVRGDRVALSGGYARYLDGVVTLGD